MVEEISLDEIQRESEIRMYKEFVKTQRWVIPLIFIMFPFCGYMIYDSIKNSEYIQVVIWVILIFVHFLNLLNNLEGRKENLKKIKELENKRTTKNKVIFDDKE